MILFNGVATQSGAGVAKGGVVRDAAVRAAAIQRVLDSAAADGFGCLGSIPSPVAGAKKGNVEQLIHLTTPESP